MALRPIVLVLWCFVPFWEVRCPALCWWWEHSEMALRFLWRRVCDSCLPYLDIKECNRKGMCWLTARISVIGCRVSVCVAMYFWLLGHRLWSQKNELVYRGGHIRPAILAACAVTNLPLQGTVLGYPLGTWLGGPGSEGFCTSTGGVSTQVGRGGAIRQSHLVLWKMPPAPLPRRQNGRGWASAPNEEALGIQSAVGRSFIITSTSSLVAFHHADAEYVFLLRCTFGGAIDLWVVQLPC